MQYRLKAIINTAIVIRRSDLSTRSKAMISRDFHEMFFNDNPQYDSRKFLAIANSITTEKELDAFIQQRKLK